MTCGKREFLGFISFVGDGVEPLALDCKDYAIRDTRGAVNRGGDHLGFVVVVSLIFSPALIFAVNGFAVVTPGSVTVIVAALGDGLPTTNVPSAVFSM